MQKKIILFGAGKRGKCAYSELKKNCEILAVADNNSEKADSDFFAVPVIKPDEIKNYLKSDADMVISAYDYPNIGKQLKSMGIDKYYVFLDGKIYNGNPKKKNEVTRCLRCVMDDSSDDTILFDEKGYCNYCSKAINDIGKLYFPNEEGKAKLNSLLNKVKQEGKNKKYDCVMGVSGGLDSCYLLYLGYKWGLRILALHIDDGYDSPIAASNLQKLISKTGFDYEVIKPDAKQYNALVLAYMKAGVANIAIPQDNILFAFIYKKIKDYNLRYFFSGGNFALECILQRGNTYTPYDVENIFDIHKKFGTEPIDKLEFLSKKQMETYKNTYRIESPTPLDYIDYNRKRAFEELNDFCGFEYYGRKHLENILTAFIQLYWFPKKFGVDKRTSHLSSMIASNQMTRDEALPLLKEPLYEETQMNEYISILKNNLKISNDEFKAIMEAPIHKHEDYATEKSCRTKTGGEQIEQG